MRGDITNKQCSIAQARASLSRLVREAEAGETVELTRRGEVVAVLIGRKRYDRLRPRLFSEAWDAFNRHVSLAELDIDPDEVFGQVRNKTP